MILPRLVTAIIGIPIVLLAIYFGNIPFFLLVLIVTAFCYQEYFFLLEQKRYSPHKVTGYACGLLLLVAIYINGAGLLSASGSRLTSLIFTLSLIVLFTIEIVKPALSNSGLEGAVLRISVTFLGIFLISWTFGHLLLLRDLNPYGDKYTFYLFILIWVADTGAYFVGKKFGSIRLVEKVSPKKTVEGGIGGIASGLLCGLILREILPLHELTRTEVLALSFVIIIIAYISDFSESLLKREAGLKDSDSLLPGHGGFLDRFDSFIFTAPVLYYYLLFFHK